MKNKITRLSTENEFNPMLVLADLENEKIVRNINNVLGLYEMMINQKQPIEATSKYLNPNYIQHNPIVPDGAEGLGLAFKQFTEQQEKLKVVVHRVIAFDNYVWAHVQFFNLLSNDENDTGIACVDIYKIDEEGKALEHWDALQIVGTPDNAAPWMAPNVSAANSNGVI